MECLNEEKNENDEEATFDEFEDVSINDVHKFPIEFRLLSSYERYSTIYDQQVTKITLPN
jgi:hypothetical protein